MPRLRPYAYLIGLSIYSVLATSHAADKSTTTEELKQLSDPTILKSRSWLDYEWNDFEGGAGDGEILFGTLWARRVSASQDWAVRLEVPFDWHVAGDLGGGDEAGLGDIEFATGTAFRIGKSWRTGGGLELHADTATNDAVGDGVWRLKPFWSVAWDAADWLTLGFTAEYNHSIAEQTGIAPQRYAEFYLPVTFLLPHSWSLSAQYKRKIDFEDGDRGTQKVKLGVAKRLSNAPVSLNASIEKELDGSDKRFEFHFVVTWYFE